MSKLSKIFVLVLSIILCMGLMATAVSATETDEAGGLKVTLTTDKLEYTALEQIKVTMKVENTAGAALKNVVASVTAPDGVHLMGGNQQLTLETLAAGATESMEVTYQAPMNPETGDNSRIVLVFAAAIVSGLAIACLAWNRKSAAMVLALVMVMALAAPVVSAAEVEAKAEVVVKVDGQKVILTATAKAEVEEIEQPPVEEPTEQTWTKVEAADDWTGTYLVVVDNGYSNIWNPAMLVGDGNYVEVPIEDGKIVGDYTEFAVKITQSTTAQRYYVQLPSGQYMTTGGNLLSGTTFIETGTPVDAVVASSEHGYITINNYTLTWNYKTNKFAATKLSLGGIGFGAKPTTTKTYLYKLEETQEQPPVEEEPTGGALTDGAQNVNASVKGVEYTYTAKQDGAYVLSWTSANAVVKVKNVAGETAIESGYEFNLVSGDVITFVMGTVSGMDTYEVKLEKKEEQTTGNVLAIGKNTIPATYDGVSYTFTPKLDGTYVVSFTTDNAFIVVEYGNVSDMGISSGYELKLTSGTVVTFIFMTNGGDETYDVTIEAKEDKPAGNVLAIGKNTIPATYDGVSYTFTPDKDGTYVVSFTTSNAFIVVEYGNVSDMGISSGYELKLTAGTTVKFVFMTNGGDETYDVTIEEKKPVPVANVNLDFQNLESGKDYTASDWRRTYGSATGFVTNTAVSMRVRSNKNASGATFGNNVLNMYTKKGTDYRYAYVADGNGLGMANYFSIELGNYFQTPSNIEFKIVLVDAEGGLHYLYGGAETWEILASTKEGSAENLKKYEKSFDAINVKEFYIEIRGTSGGDQYVYMDNVVLTTKDAQPTYVKTTSATDWSGTYLVVADGASKVWDPNKLAAVNGNGSDVEIKDGKITGDYAAFVIKITKAPTAGRYYIQVANGKYLAMVAGGFLPELGLSDTPYEWNIQEAPGVGYLNYPSGSMYLSWYTSTDLMTGEAIARFQFLSKSATNGTMTYLYKLEEN